MIRFAEANFRQLQSPRARRIYHPGSLMAVDFRDHWLARPAG
jgi:hypothetical protein